MRPLATDSGSLGTVLRATEGQTQEDVWFGSCDARTSREERLSAEVATGGGVEWVNCLRFWVGELQAVCQTT